MSDKTNYYKFKGDDPVAELYIDGKKVERYIDDIEFVKRVSRELDSLHVRFITSEMKEYEPYKIAQFYFYGEKHTMIVENHNVAQLDEETFEHELDFKSAIFYFDEFWPPNRIFSETFDDGINTIRKILEVYANSTEQRTTLFEFDDLDVYEERITRTEYVNENLSAILFNLFRRIFAYPMLEYDDELKRFKLFPRFEGEFIGDEPIEARRNSFVSNADVVSSATRATATIENGIYEQDGGEEWFPSENSGVRPRTLEFIQTQNNARYIMPNKIAEIIRVDVVDGLTWVDDNDQLQSADAPEMLTGRIVPSSVHDNSDDPFEPNIDEAGAFDQSNLIPYDIGSREIGPMQEDEEGLIFSETRDKMFNAMEVVVAENLDFYYDYIKSLGSDILGGEDNKEQMIRPTFQSGSADVRDVPLRFKYRTFRNMSYTIEKQNIKGSAFSTKQTDQRSSRVEIKQHKKALNRLANQLGERNRTSDGVFVDENPPFVGNWDDDLFIVTEARYNINPSRIRAEWKKNKNVANIEAETSISNEPYPYSITGKEVLTNLQTHDYVILSETKQPKQHSFLTEDGRKALLNVFDYAEPNNRPIAAGYYHASELNDDKSLHVIPNVGGNDNVITVNFSFNHETVAYRGIKGYDGKEGRQNAYIKYTDDNGKVQDFNVVYTTNFSVREDGALEDFYDYPKTEVQGQRLLEVDRIQAFLDPNAALGHTHNIHIVTDTPEKIINTGGLSRNANIVGSLGGSRDVKIYYRSMPFSYYDKKIKNETEDENAAVNFSSNSDEYKLQISKSDAHRFWAVVVDGEILFAYNDDDETEKTIYFNFSRRRNGFIETGISNNEYQDFVREVNLAFETDYAIETNKEIEEEINTANQIKFETEIGDVEITKVLSEEFEKESDVNFATELNVEAFDVIEDFVSKETGIGFLTDYNLDVYAQRENEIVKLNDVKFETNYSLEETLEIKEEIDKHSNLAFETDYGLETSNAGGEEIENATVVNVETDYDVTTSPTVKSDEIQSVSNFYVTTDYNVETNVEIAQTQNLTHSRQLVVDTDYTTEENDIKEADAINVLRTLEFATEYNVDVGSVLDYGTIGTSSNLEFETERTIETGKVKPSDDNVSKTSDFEFETEYNIDTEKEFREIENYDIETEYDGTNFMITITNNEEVAITYQVQHTEQHSGTVSANDSVTITEETSDFVQLSISLEADNLTSVSEELAFGWHEIDGSTDYIDISLGTKDNCLSANSAFDKAQDDSDFPSDPDYNETIRITHSYTTDDYSIEPCTTYHFRKTHK